MPPPPIFFYWSCLNIKTLSSGTLLQAMIHTHVVQVMFGFCKAITYADIHSKNVQILFIHYSYLGLKAK